MERIGEAVPQPEATGESQKPHMRLSGLVIAAEAIATDEERRELAGQINELLIAMRSPGDEAEETKVVVAHLNADVLSTLVDAKGRNCRRVAAKTLLSFGYPFALQLSPEELALARSSPSAPRSGEPTVAAWVETATRTRKFAAVSALIGAVATILLTLSSGARGDLFFFTLLASLVSGFTGGALATSKPKIETQVAPAMGLLFPGVALLIVTLAGNPAALAGVVANAIGLIALLGWQYVPDNRTYRP